MKRNKDGSLSLTELEIYKWQDEQDNKRLSQKQIEQSEEFLHSLIEKQYADPVYDHPYFK